MNKHTDQGRTELLLRLSCVALACALLALMVSWYLLIAPPDPLPAWLPLLLLTPPLMIALPGLLRGHVRTFQWLTLALMLYWAHGLTELAANAEVRVLAIAECLLAFALFAACIIYLRGVRTQPN